MESEVEFSHLIELRLAGFVSIEALSERIGLAAGAVQATTAALSDRGLVIQRWGARPGVMLSAAGRSHVETKMRSQLVDLGVAGAVHELYEDFLPLNSELLEVCVRWQMIPTAESSLGASGETRANSHDDQNYDDGVLAELSNLHVRALPLSERMGEQVARFGRYGRRLTRAVESLGNGQREWFVSPTVDSYHSVWMEWHQDLLASLGRTRKDERC